jgi:hypothetical protein
MDTFKLIFFNRFKLFRISFYDRDELHNFSEDCSVIVLHNESIRYQN